MQAKEYCTIDKSEWGPGPWQDEPDKAQWQDEETGLPCLIVRNAGGALCGYVGVSGSHPWFGKGYSDEVEIGDALDREVESHRLPTIPMMIHACKEDKSDGKAAIDIVLDAHGGITFADACQESDDPSKGICHLPDAGEPDNVWWFGFDCSHSEDLSPAYEKRFYSMGIPGHGGTYRDIDYVKAEIRGLAKQLASVSMTTDSKSERMFWGGVDDEVLLHYTPDEAIEAYLDELHPVGFDEIGEVTMYEYRPMKPELSDCGSPLEAVLERLDEEYGNPDGDWCDATPAMKEAEQTFLKAVLAEYRPWACEQTGKKITVNALEWVREHRPDWLENLPK